MQLGETLKQVEDFNSDINRYHLNTDFKELQFSRGKRNYNTILKRLRELNIPNPLLFTYTTLTFKEFISYLESILNKIFSNRYSLTIREYNDLILLEDINNPFDAVLETELIGDIPKIKNYHISKKLASIQVASTAHEYIHGLLSKYSTTRFNDVISNVHYNELLSILIEYITIYELSQFLKQDNLVDKHHIIRINNCQEHAIADAESQALIASLCHQKLDYLTSIVLQKCKSYSEHTSFRYIISNIYAIKLFELYQDDPTTLIRLFNSIIDGQNNINNLLKYYNLDLRQTDTIAPFTKQLEKIK